MKITKAATKIPYGKEIIDYAKSFFRGRYLFNKEFYRYYNLLQESQWWSKEQLKEYQWNQIKKLLQHVYAYVPYYQEMFKNLGAAPEDIKDYNDFKKIPVLTKDIVKERLNDLVPRGIDKNNLMYYTTGGSTGLPLGLYKEMRDNIMEEAFMMSQWGRMGFKPGDLRVILRGDIVPRKKLWHYNPFYNFWIFSSYHLSEEYIDRFVKKLNLIKPQFIHAYPSSLWVFINLIKESGLTLSFTPKVIFCGSENLAPFQRKLFEDFCNCRVYTWLGLTEASILAGECEQSSRLHIFSEYSFVELIDNNDNIITEPSKPGQIIGTSFKHYMTPFIRYKTGDIASYADGNCSCGRNYRLLDKVEGRTQELVCLQNGKIIPVTGLIFGQHFAAFQNIQKMQLEQKQIGELIIRIIKGKTFSHQDQQEIERAVNKGTDDSLSITFELVDTIPRTKSGKHKFLIQHLPIKFYNN